MNNLCNSKINFTFLLLFSVFTQLSAQENNQISDEPYAYQVIGYVNAYLYNGQEVKPSGNQVRLGNYKYNMVGKYQITESNTVIEYVLLQLQPFSFKISPVVADKDSAVYKDSLYIVKKNSRNQVTESKYIKKSPNVVDIEEQQNVYVLQSAIFDYQLEQGFIRKQYETSWRKSRFDWGASLSVPFKIRPEIRNINMKITPEIALGGFVGFKKRINQYKPHYWYFPVVTAGVTIIGINQDNTIVEQETQDIKDGLVFARTFTLGTLVQLDDFQLGLMIGWDKAGGEIGKDWIYNDRLWYSFSLGFDFIRNDKKENSVSSN